MAFASLQISIPAPSPVRSFPPIKFCAKIRVASNDIQPVQKRSKVQQSKITSSDTSRRDVLTSMSAALLATFLASSPAEARSVKPETRRKIREKLDKLREKAGIPKEKGEPKSADKEKLPSTPSKGSLVPLVEAINLKQ